VVFLETRVEKRKRLRKHNRKKVYKFIIIAFAVIILYLGIKVVNQNIVYLGYLENQNIFKINILKGKLNLFGKGYYIDLKILKKKD
jgi:hypothetical protein